jgi:class 3 adenylate cyclase/tetratricopeptide (TPR) repeat protein
MVSPAPAAATGGRQQRRQVSVLFLDVVGSTAMTSQLDPEDVQEVMDGALRAFTQVVQQHGGTVLQYAGDSILAAFGTPLAREDDAERAVHAGLTLLASAREQAARVQRLFGFAGFDIRLGIHTGHVLLGGGVDEDGTIRGFTVNIAARLEQTAPPGHLRISQETWRHVRGVFEAQAQPPLQVKGQDEPLATWFVHGVRPRAFRLPTRGVEGVETPLIGREPELQALLAGFEAVLSSGRQAALTVIAEAGLGKSRLLHELQHRLDTHPRACWLLLARAGPSGLLRPYGLLRDLLAWRLDIADSDSAGVAREKWLAGLVPLLGEQGLNLACALGHLVGLDFSSHDALAGLHQDARLLRDRAWTAFATYVQALAHSVPAVSPADTPTPVVMLLDDLHWADDASLDWLQQLFTRTELPLLLVLGGRPPLLERRPAWGQDAPQHQRLVLAALDGDARRALGNAVLQRLGAVPEALAQLLEHRAEGNPYYAEELVQMLLDDGVITRERGVPGEPEQWRLHAQRLDVARIPGTLVGVLQARLDALGDTERRTLQNAAIVGPVFWEQALEAVSDDRETPAAQTLPLLQQRGMVQAHAQSVFEGTREQAFHHHLLHQVTYDTILRAERRAGHALAAAWLAERVGDREEEYLAVTAEHYERAGEAEAAMRWYVRAVHSATRRCAYAAAALYIERGMALLGAQAHAMRWEFEFARYALADIQGRRDEQERAGLACIHAAQALGDDHLLAIAYNSQALLHDRKGEYEPARALATQALAVAEPLDDSGRMAAALAELAWLAYQRGEGLAARALAERAVGEADRAGERMLWPTDKVYAVTVRLVAAYIEQSLGEPERVARLNEQAMAQARELGSPRPLVSTLVAVGEHRWKLGDLVQARALCEECLRLASAIGLGTYQAVAHHNLAEVCAQQDDWPGALVHCDAAYRIYAANGQPSQANQVLMLRPRVQAALGRFDAALQDVQLALAHFQRSADPHRSCRLRLCEAEVLRQRGDLPAARAIVEAELQRPELDTALDEGMAPPEARADLWRVLAGAGDPRAGTHLQAALAAIATTCARLADPADRERVLSVPRVTRELMAAARAAGLSPLP